MVIFTIIGIVLVTVLAGISLAGVIRIVVDYCKKEHKN